MTSDEKLASRHRYPVSSDGYLARLMGFRSVFDESAPGDDWPTWMRSRLRIVRQREDQKRYGDLLADVIFLRQRDFTVFLDGHDKDGNPSLICDGKPITADEVRAKAARERRLLGHE